MTSTSPRPRPPSVPSTSSIRAPSVQSSRLPPPISTVITSPPWAKDEPPSPKELHLSEDNRNYVDSHLSDVNSFHSTFNSNNSASRWWSFTLPRPRGPDSSDEHLSNRKTMTLKDRTKSWLPSTPGLRDSPLRKLTEKSVEEQQQAESSQNGRRNWNLSIAMPVPGPFTVSQNLTPGWETPWTARPTAQGPFRNHERENSYGLNNQNEDDSSHSSGKNDSSWAKRKKRLRIFILNNTYVPLLFRLANIAFTTAALGVAIRIRQRERQNNLMGAVGSSPTLIIIFAPLTLVHVMVAIYLEYFGRPLGLWRTSAKLAHTLLEVLFICAWSAALSLCFDNFFTSLVPCANVSATSWYNDLPRPPSNLPTFEGSIGDEICDNQLILICLVGIGLLMYCTNLVISLFRIFEKVKYHHTPARPRVGFQGV
ncbi:hypothetical protein K435DRAFT_746085 [Dendrothele bispora CBS 962.96]|uniref:Uncharacterized protein n=1 Tax=Dendrothele bispora (strain CBS 962.96) TaxID=1314807 RepID=A0A4S8MR59_DENBC|nr:hypothetical protein K435DRAFT_758784 [Dendrothele bispora CBS 962.96]THV04824.1 hypothetical protein K435DRAFT_746085 [Dendrothele bispora CBS 962.96]